MDEENEEDDVDDVDDDDVWTIHTIPGDHFVCNVAETYDVNQGQASHLALNIVDIVGEVTTVFRRGKTKVLVNGDEIGSIVPVIAGNDTVVVAGVTRNAGQRKVVYFKNGSQMAFNEDWIASDRPRPTLVENEEDDVDEENEEDDVDDTCGTTTRGTCSSTRRCSRSRPTVSPRT